MVLKQHGKSVLIGEILRLEATLARRERDLMIIQQERRSQQLILSALVAKLGGLDSDVLVTHEEMSKLLWTKMESRQMDKDSEATTSTLVLRLKRVSEDGSE